MERLKQRGADRVYRCGKGHTEPMQSDKYSGELVLTTDVGPVIDQEAFDAIQKHITRLHSESKVLVAEGAEVRFAQVKGGAHRAGDTEQNTLTPKLLRPRLPLKPPTDRKSVV